MPRILRLASPWLVVAAFFSLWAVDASGAPHLDLRSAILLDTTDGQVLYEQNADMSIPPASVTKILTLYLIFDAIKQGQVHPSDRVPVSKRAANTGGSRMGLRAGKDVPLEELIKGIAVVSGNDAAVAAAEYLSGNVESFVMKMNVKARELGMTNSEFMTPNGLPAKGQVTTARDLARLSSSYIRHYPESLHIHSMTSYTYLCSTHHNANRLLGVCPGVDGIKTGFVCASGFNLAATAKRGDVRLIAVVLGARSPWIRTMETERLLEAGFQKLGSSEVKDPGSVEEILAHQDATRNARNAHVAAAVPTGGQGSHANRKRLKGHPSLGKVTDASRICPLAAKSPKLVKKAAPAEDSCPVGEQAKAKTTATKGKLQLVKQTGAAKATEATAKSATTEGHTTAKKQTTTKEAAGSKKVNAPPKTTEQEKSTAVQVASKPTTGTKQKSASASSNKTN